MAGEAYPLRNISHVGQRKPAVDKRAAWKQFIGRTLICLFFGSFLAAGAGTIGVLILLALEACEERFGKLLRRIAAIAAAIGEVGVPVITAVKALLGSS
ncbi:DUF6232 family protein [Streptomyces galilaeus]